MKDYVLVCTRCGVMPVSKDVMIGGLVIGLVVATLVIFWAWRDSE